MFDLAALNFEALARFWTISTAVFWFGLLLGLGVHAGNQLGSRLFGKTTNQSITVKFGQTGWIVEKGEP